jgi:para-nitrobenzyl esterase
VTINYRLGIFGTLAHPQLARESTKKVSGNYAFLDMVAAIKWTRRNILAFGGDPERITLYGESAGGRAVSALATSPLVRGAIHGVIAGDTIYGLSWQSGKLTDAERAGVEFANAAGVASIGDLRHMRADELMLAASKYNYRQYEFVVDGWALSGDVFAAQKSGAQHDIPILTGVTSDFATPILNPVSAHEFEGEVRKNYGELSERFLALYPNASDTEAYRSQLASATDSLAWIHSEWAAAHTRTGHPAYLYLFTHAVPPPPGAQTIFRSSALLPKQLGAYHTGEIAYAFDSLAKRDWPWTSADHKLADIMSSYWVNFAAKGDPNGPGLPEWPAYGKPPASIMELGDEVRLIPSILDKDKMQFWAKYFTGMAEK